PPKADGTFDEETIAVLKSVGEWFRINGEGIYATRPWKTYGEGPHVDMKHRDNRSPYTHKNIRFTRSKDGKTLFAILMGWPGDNKSFVLKSLAKGAPGESLKVKEVSMLG